MKKKSSKKVIVQKKDGTIKTRIPVPPTRIIEDKRKKKKYKKDLSSEE